jgi:hypothetical protein
VKHLFIAMGTALVVSASMVAPAGATELDLNGRAFAGPDGTLYVGHNGTRQPLQLAAATDEQLANIPLVNDPAVVRLDSDPRVTGVYSWWGTGDPLRADAALQGQALRLNGSLYVYRDSVLYRIELADVPAEQFGALPLAAGGVDR